MSASGLQVSQLSSTTANLQAELQAARERKAALELEGSALELAKAKLQRETEALVAAAAKSAESVEQLEALLAVQTKISISAEAGLKASDAQLHQVCKAPRHCLSEQVGHSPWKIGSPHRQSQYMLGTVAMQRVLTLV